MTDFLAHHGIKGQKWGVRNGPPYPLKGANVKQTGYTLRYKKGEKKYYINSGSKTQTLSYDKNRLNGADMYYASLTPRDKNYYKTWFNAKIPNEEKDENGKRIGPAFYLKYNIQTQAVKDVNVANEREGIDAMVHLMETSRDFSNFVTDKTRMSELMDKRRAQFASYKEALNVLDSIGPDSITEEQAALLYRVFNYVIPAQGSDVQRQRARFFKELQNRGYGAVLDTNDSEYGRFHREMPVIIFDTGAFVFTDAERVSLGDKTMSQVKSYLNVPF